MQSIDCGVCEGSGNGPSGGSHYPEWCESCAGVGRTQPDGSRMPLAGKSRKTPQARIAELEAERDELKEFRAKWVGATTPLIEHLKVMTEALEQIADPEDDDAILYSRDTARAALAKVRGD